MIRYMTFPERNYYSQLYPHLDVTRYMVTGEQTPVYNCIAWTVGVTNRWYWPGNTLDDFDRFYAAFGMQRARYGDVAAWGYAENNMTHGSISRVEEEMRWESKCGALLRILHDYDELRGPNPSYGNIICTYQRVEDGARAQEIIASMSDQPGLTPTHITTLRKHMMALPKELIERFDDLFEKWKETWYYGELGANSDPAARRESPEFAALVDMGEDILPLVVNMMTDPANFIAMQLYEALQPDKDLHTGRTIENVLTGEQGMALTTAIRYIESR